MLLDIGVGILAALGLVAYAGVEPTLTFVLAGIFFALLPDLDALISLVRNRGTSEVYRHRDLFHIPLVYIPLGATLLSFIDPSLALLFAVTTFAHFVHDSIGIGWGVQWLAPFQTDHFSFLYLYQPPGKPALPRQLVYRFPHAQMQEIERKHGDPDWITHIYWQMHPFAMVELGVFAAGLSALYLAFM